MLASARGSFLSLTVALVVLGGAAYAQSTTRVSLDSNGVQGNLVSYVASISADGRFVAFSSSATNLVHGDTNGVEDIFVRDRLLGTTERISVGLGGLEPTGESRWPSISADGRYVVFTSLATNLVAGDTNGVKDVFLHDRRTGATQRVSVDSSGVEGNADSGLFPLSISADGRFVAFLSDASNLVTGDTNGVRDVFVHDCQTGITERVSVGSAGTEANSYSDSPSISSDGRFVAFSSQASNLSPFDVNSSGDTFVRDRQSGTTEVVSVASGGTQASGGCGDGSISGDGRFVAFTSNASTLVPGDSGGTVDVFVRDRQTATTVRASVASSGAEGNDVSQFPSISSDGRFIAFYSYATNLVPGDTNGTSDVFVHARQSGVTERASVDSGGAQGNYGSNFASISADGRFVAFPSEATNLVAGDTNNVRDVFVRDRGIPDCNGNGIDDGQDVQTGTSPDCNDNGIPDECDLLQGTTVDCDGNGLLDSCEIAGNPLLDIDLDGVLDSCPPDCQPAWQTNIGGYAGLDNSVSAMIVFDDGTGPALFLGGAFSTAGGVPASRVAKWNGATWSALGSGLTGGTGGGQVSALAVYDDGSGPALYACGSFTSAGGTPASGIAKWDGLAWSPIGSLPAGSIDSLAVYDDGAGPELYCGGGNAGVAALYKWNGSVMTPVPVGVLCTSILSMLAFDDGGGSALYMGGSTWGFSGLVARWDGVTWTQYVDPSTYFLARALATYNDGTGLKLHVGMSDGFGSSYASVERLNGSTLNVIGNFDGALRALCSFDDGTGSSLFACGTFLHVGSVVAPRIAKWNGSAWSSLASGTSGPVLSSCPFDDGGGPRLFVGGAFTAVDYTPANRIAQWGLPDGCPHTGNVICEPGVSGVMPCPCSNPPSGASRGCNNSSGTGGAWLAGTGHARLGADTLVFTTHSEKPTALSIVLQGTTAIGTGVTFGQGVRCVSGAVRRMYVKAASNGSITAPGPGDSAVAARSAMLGDPIAAGTHRTYGVYYRDSTVLGGCSAASTFNMTQQLDVLWDQ